MTNEEVRGLALEIAVQSELPFKESRIFWNGARFAPVLDFLERETVEEGDEVRLSLITRSSYDKSWRYETALMGKRLLCDNGAVPGEFFARVSFRHLRSGDEADDWKEIVRQGLSVSDQAPENLHAFVQRLRILKGQTMTVDHLREVWKWLPNRGRRSRPDHGAVCGPRSTF